MATKSYSNNTGVKVTGATFASVVQSVSAILDAEILVGIPSDTSDRPADLAPQDEDALTNAQLAYIHDNGVPEVGIPQREFMRPGIESVSPEIQRRLGQAMRAAMRGDALRAEFAMLAAGLAAESGIRNYIDAGVPPPLAEYTLKKRVERGRGHKGAMTELDRRMEGLAPSTAYAKPLIDSGEMRKAIKHVIRQRRRK